MTEKKAHDLILFFDNYEEPESEEDEFDEEALRDLVVASLKMDIPKFSYNFGKPIYITKKAFMDIRSIANTVHLFYGTECAGFLYGKNDTITNVKRYICNQGPALVSGNPMDVVKQLEKGSLGLFHSHLFDSGSPSGVDKEVLGCWTQFTEGKDFYMIITHRPYWMLKCWSMTPEYELTKHELVVK